MYASPKFKKGDRVKVRNLTSPYKGSKGIVKGSSFKEGTGFSYVVEIEWEGQARANSFMEQELEKVK